MQNNPIFITSFSKKMYEITGKRCVESLLKYTTYDIVVLLEDQETLDIDSKRIILHSIYEYGYFNNVKTKNLDIIPKHYGGISKIKAKSRDNYYNYNAINWWKKISAMYIANKNYKNNMLLWIDCDCYLKKEIDLHFIKELFNGYDMFYFKGKRDGVESGLLGFSPDHPIMIRFFSYLQNEFEFRKYTRYDDGYLLSKAIEELNSINAYDLNTNPYIERHPLKKYKEFLKHEKGTHRDVGIHVDTR